MICGNGWVRDRSQSNGEGLGNDHEGHGGIDTTIFGDVIESSDEHE